MTRSSFGARHHLKLYFDHAQTLGGLSFLVITFQRNGSKALEKTLLNHKSTKG